MSDLVKARATTFVVAALGALVFVLAGLPLPLLLGPLMACLVAALFGARMATAGTFGTFMRTFLGVAVGASITPDIISELPAMAGSLVFVPLFIAVIAVIGYPLFRFGFKMNHPTAWYAAMPGGLQDMLVFGEEAGGDVRALSLIHATRVLVVVTAAPILMTLVWNADLTAAPGRPLFEADPMQLALMLVCGVGGWKIAERVGLFGASILGPMILTAIFSLSGLITERPPAEIIWAVQFFIGIAVGAKYTGITLHELKVDVLAGFVYALILAGISLVFIELIYLTGTAPAIDAFLAFLPGGQAEMVVIAIMAGGNLTYVICHHLLRIVLVILLAPVVDRLFRRRGGG